jgi:hypothetical protein
MAKHPKPERFSLRVSYLNPKPHTLNLQMMREAQYPKPERVSTLRRGLVFRPMDDLRALGPNRLH